jgi:uncharacterized protein DUF4128
MNTLSYEDLHTAIANRLEAMWNNFCDITAENTMGKQPEDVPFVVWSVRPNDSISADVSATTERVTGLIFFQVFLPENSGTLTAHKVRDKVASMYNEAHFQVGSGGAIRCKRAKLIYSGKRGGFVMHNVTVEFLADNLALNAP